MIALVEHGDTIRQILLLQMIVDRAATHGIDKKLFIVFQQSIHINQQPFHLIAFTLEDFETMNFLDKTGHTERIPGVEMPVKDLFLLTALALADRPAD